MRTVRQKFPPTPPLDIRATVLREFEKVRPRLKPGARIAVAVGSRGISHLQNVVAAVIEVLNGAGAKPFIVPAMGSHGGATPAGQTELLAEYGVTERQLGVPIDAAMEVERLGATADGVDVFFSAAALRADGIVVVNRIKPHTDFGGAIGSGVLKMIVVGLGKRIGAANYHVASTRLGYEHVIRTIAQVTLRSAPILCGVAIVENQFHQAARLAVLPGEEIERAEEELFLEAKRLMPRLPFADIDLLIVDRIGKNISGAGMDPNITGRGVHGYSSMINGQESSGPRVRRLFVRELTPETHGNGIGIGLADLTTARLVRALNKEVTYVNALTSLSPNSAKIPIHFETDREAVAQALASLGMADVPQAKVMRIADTLSLETIQVSETCAQQDNCGAPLQWLSDAEEMQFDQSGNLSPLPSS
jgi:hypothetical protein